MTSDVVPKKEVDAESPGSNSKLASSAEKSTGRAQSNGKASSAQNGTTNGQFPPPKTDKPRPHVCTTCTRSFARLEHLKRHERSHTKEKPFECGECTRCFARRDLLLRHQQKLHQAGAPSSRPRSGRRESVSGASVAGGRVRKNSMANGSFSGSNGQNGFQRPRAMTLSHLDVSALQLQMNNSLGNSMTNSMDNLTFSRMNPLGLAGQHMNMGGLPGPSQYDYRGMSTSIGAHGNSGLSRLQLNTHAMVNMSIPEALHTAPAYANGSFGGFSVDQLSSGTTINPAQLHFGNSDSSTQPIVPPNVFNGWWQDLNNHMNQANNENAIDESSPSRMSSGDSPSEFPESMTNSAAALPMQNNNLQWTDMDSPSQHALAGSPLQMQDFSATLPIIGPPQATISPDTLHEPMQNVNAYQLAMMQQQHQNQLQEQQLRFQQNGGLPQFDAMPGTQQPFFPPSLSGFDSDSPSMSSSMTGSARHSSVTSMSTNSFTEGTRQALLTTLSQFQGFGHNTRKYSQPTISSPLSGSARSSQQEPNLPPTNDIRRFVESFFQHAHPHLPVLHLPTLSFDGIDDATNNAGSPNSMLSHDGLGNGAGCLVLMVAAIGALYEYEIPASKELFEAGKKTLNVSLENYRKANVSAAVSSRPNPNNEPRHRAPLWLVQAMLLNVVYGHQCGDRISANIATTSCAALASLARYAKLNAPLTATSSPASEATGSGTNDVDMSEHSIGPEDSVSRHQSAETDLHAQWIMWKTAEERKRTMFAVHTVSSILTTAYNHQPTISNSEIHLDLPCNEALYNAETAQQWQLLGGLAAAENNSIDFSSALEYLLTAHRRNGQSQTNASGDAVEYVLQPSTFGCLVLINALHTYIFVTKNQRLGADLTSRETNVMFEAMEPTLKAWQDAFKMTPHHRIERPNPYGMGPLAADCLPLLDLAFVRLFVNMGRSKEAFWNRDFDLMARELGPESGMPQLTGFSPSAGETAGPGADMNGVLGSPTNSSDGRRPSHGMSAEQASSARERQLRKAAFYAVDALKNACRCNLTYVDAAAHELPVQSAMCFFDCAQVLAEYACTVQERVGGYVGVLGRDQIDFTEVPAIMLLTNEDIELLGQINEICNALEMKRIQSENMLAMELQALDPTALATLETDDMSGYGFGSRVLRVTAKMLEKAVVWPVTQVMAEALKVQAGHLDRRANASTVSR